MTKKLTPKQKEALDAVEQQLKLAVQIMDEVQADLSSLANKLQNPVNR